MKNIHKPKFKPTPDRDAELDRIIARVNYICDHYPDSSIRRTILARYEQEMDELSKRCSERRRPAMTLNEILEIADVRNYRLSVKIGRSLTSCIECDTRNEPQMEDIEMLYGSYHVTRLGSCGSALEVDLEMA